MVTCDILHDLMDLTYYSCELCIKLQHRSNILSNVIIITYVQLLIYVCYKMLEKFKALKTSQSVC